VADFCQFDQSGHCWHGAAVGSSGHAWSLFEEDSSEVAFLSLLVFCLFICPFQRSQSYSLMDFLILVPFEIFFTVYGSLSSSDVIDIDLSSCLNSL